MWIPGEVIAAVTFPGVVVHEMGHQLMCRFFRVAVFDVCYFQFGTPAGFVVHEPARKPIHSVWIGVAPFLVNTLLGALIALPAAIPVFMFGDAMPHDYVLMWLGVSITMHAFPSTGDAHSIWQAVKEERTSFLTRCLATPIVGLIYLGALGSVIWLDVIYGVGVAIALPYLLVKLLV